MSNKIKSKRRSFLFTATYTIGAVGLGATIWPLVDQMIFIVLSFFLIPLLLSVPYFFSIYNISLLNSYFESVSGFTTTGFSIIENVKSIDEQL